MEAGVPGDLGAGDDWQRLRIVVISADTLDILPTDLSPL